MAAEKHYFQTTKPSCSNLRGNSNGKTQIPRHVSSRYLSNSISSCHNLCKTNPPFPAISEKFSSSTVKPPFSVSAHPRAKSTRNSSSQLRIYKKKSKVDEEKIQLPAATLASPPGSTSNREKCKRVQSKFGVSKPKRVTPSNSEKKVKKPMKEVKKGSAFCTLSPGSSSRPSRSCSFKYGSPKSGYKGNFNGLLDSQGKSMNRPRNRGEEKCCSPRKLQFRRGKVVEAKPESSNARRLQFRKVTLVDEIQLVGDNGRRFYRRTEINAAEVKKPKSEKILLRHRSMEKRKRNHNLFNNMIEETATKLAVSRKSKVQALVDAFETVILLHDTKQEQA